MDLRATVVAVTSVSVFLLLPMIGAILMKSFSVRGFHIAMAFCSSYGICSLGLGSWFYIASFLILTVLEKERKRKNG